MYLYCLHCDAACRADMLEDLEFGNTYFILFTCPYCNGQNNITVDLEEDYES